MKRITRIGPVLTAAAVAALTVGGASGASAQQLQGSFAGYQLERDGVQVVTIKAATASWTQPKVTVRGFHNAYSEAFLGMNDQNGEGEGVEQDNPQVGTEADSIGGKARYYAFYTPPHGANCFNDCAQFRFPNTVKPGDHLSAFITVSHGDQPADHFTIKLADTRYRKNLPPLRWTQTVSFNCPAAAYPEFVSAGVGAPQNPVGNVVPLADFGTVRFTGVQVNGEVIGGYQGLSSKWNDYLSPSDRIIASPSAITGNGGTFTTTWKRSS